jgi:hypothetical protein
MRRIIRRNLIRDAAGRPLSVQSERLTDDGRGSLQQTSERTSQRCGGCSRPITDLDELRGTCDCCHTRGCCIHCVSHCEVCSRQLCGHCRRGFAGPPALTACAICQQRLLQRQELQDQHSAFEQEMARHRLFHQEEALRLNFEKARLAAEFQAARLGLNKVSWPIWVLQRLWWVLKAVVCYVWRHLR